MILVGTCVNDTYFQRADGYLGGLQSVPGVRRFCATYGFEADAAARGKFGNIEFSRAPHRPAMADCGGCIQ